MASVASVEFSADAGARMTEVHGSGGGAVSATIVTWVALSKGVHFQFPAMAVFEHPCYAT